MSKDVLDQWSEITESIAEADEPKVLKFIENSIDCFPVLPRKITKKFEWNGNTRDSQTISDTNLKPQTIKT